MPYNYATDLVIDRVDLVPDGANSEAFIMIFKGKESVPNMTLDEILGKLEPEHAEVVRAELAKANDASTVIKEELASVKDDLAKALEANKALEAEVVEVSKSKSSTEPGLEEVLKGLDPTVRSVFDTLTKQKEIAEQTAKQLVKEKEDADNLVKAKELSHIPANEEDMVKMIPGMSQEVFDLLKSIDAVFADSTVMTELGKGKGDAGTGDAWSKIEKKAADMAKELSITKEEAISRVVKENPALYKEYLERSAD